MYRYDESLLCGVAEAHGVEGGVGSVALQEFGVSALLDDATGLQDDDIVGSLDGRETVGDHYGGATAQETAQALLHDQFGHGIDVGCRLVEDEDARIGQQGAGEGDELALAHAQVTPAFANGRIVAVGQLQHQFVQADGAGRLLDLFVCGVQATVANVLADSAGEEEWLLQHNADLAAQRTLRHVADIVSIDEDGPFLDVIETRDQAGDGAFARARRPDDGDGLPRLNGKIKVAQHGQFGMVAEGDMAKLDAALDGRHLTRVWPVGDFDGYAQNLEDALSRYPGALQLRVLLAQVADGVEKAVDVEREGHEDANLQRPLHDERAAVDDREHDSQRGHHLDERQDEGGHAAGFQVGVAVVGVQFIEFGAVALLTDKALDDAHAGDVLLQRGVDHRDGGARAAERARGVLLPEGGNHDHDGQHGEGEQRQRHIHRQHGPDNAHQRHQRTEHGEQARTQHRFQHVDIALQARHHARDLLAIIEAERQLLQVREHI